MQWRCSVQYFVFSSWHQKWIASIISEKTIESQREGWMHSTLGFLHMMKSVIPDQSQIRYHSFKQFFPSLLFPLDASDVNREEERWALKIVGYKLFPDKVLGFIPVKLELKNCTCSDFQCSVLLWSDVEHSAPFDLQLQYFWMHFSRPFVFTLFYYHNHFLKITDVSKKLIFCCCCSKEI